MRTDTPVMGRRRALPGAHLDGHIRHEAIVGRDEDETPVHECLWLHLYFGFVASLPAATMNPEDDRVILALLGSVDIEGLTLVLGLS